MLENGKGELAYAGPYGITVAIRRHLQALEIRARWGKPTHALRAKWITDRFREGVDLVTIQRGAGHRRLDTTPGYISEPDAHLRRAAENVDRNWREIGASQKRVSQLFDNTN